MTETIVAAAIQYEGKTYTLPAPAKHWKIVLKIMDDFPKFDYKAGGHTEGFLTSTGLFVNRFEAGRIAQAAGQVRVQQPNFVLVSGYLW